MSMPCAPPENRRLRRAYARWPRHPTDRMLRAMPDPGRCRRALRPEPISDDRYRVTNTGDAEHRDVVFGGQFLAQAIVTVVDAPSGQGRPLDPGDLRPSGPHRRAHRVGRRVDPRRAHVRERHRAPSWQGDRLCARFMVLLDADEPDVVRHDVADAPRVPRRRTRRRPTRACSSTPVPSCASSTASTSGRSDAPAGPAETFLWAKAPPLPDDPAVHQRGARLGHRRLPDRHRAPTPRRRRPGRRPPRSLHRRRRPHDRVPRAVPRRRVAAARAPAARTPVAVGTFGTADVFTARRPVRRVVRRRPTWSGFFADPGAGRRHAVPDGDVSGARRAGSRSSPAPAAASARRWRALFAREGAAVAVVARTEAGLRRASPRHHPRHRRRHRGRRRARGRRSAPTSPTRTTSTDSSTKPGPRSARSTCW